MLSGNYSSGQLSLAFLSSDSCIFLPIFGGDLVAGRPSRKCAREAWPAAWLCFQEGRLPAPQSWRGPQGGGRRWLLGSLGKEVKLCFSFQPLREEFVLRCFCRWRIFLPLLGEDSPPPRPAPHTIPPPQLLGISSPKPPAFTRNPPFSFLLQEKRQGHLPESLALSSATLGLP